MQKAIMFIGALFAKSTQRNIYSRPKEGPTDLCGTKFRTFKTAAYFLLRLPALEANAIMKTVTNAMQPKQSAILKIYPQSILNHSLSFVPFGRHAANMYFNINTYLTRGKTQMPLFSPMAQ